MDALLMCGGDGTRLESDREKPLYEIGDDPMIDLVLDALAESRIETTHAVVSPATPTTREYLAIPTIDAPGDGYVADLQYAIERVDPPVLTVVTDLPLLERLVVDTVLNRFESLDSGNSLTICVPASLKRALGVSVGTTRNGDGRPMAPTGLNVVADGPAEETMITWDARLAVNVNRRSDAAIVEDLT